MANLSSVPQGPQAVPQEMDPTTGQSQDTKQTLGFCQVSLELWIKQDVVLNSA